MSDKLASIQARGGFNPLADSPLQPLIDSPLNLNREKEIINSVVLFLPEGRKHRVSIPKHGGWVVEDIYQNDSGMVDKFLSVNDDSGIPLACFNLRLILGFYIEWG